MALTFCGKQSEVLSSKHYKGQGQNFIKHKVKRAMSKQYKGQCQNITKDNGKTL